MTARCDVLIVGGGIVGLTTARALASRLEGISVVIMEKEAHVGAHQTSHNSGVLHSGLYYRPGSLKASLCVSGRRLMAAFCEENGLPLRMSGKIVVAAHQGEIEALEELHRRGTANGLEGIEWLDRGGLTAIEPEVTGVRGLFVPETAVLDFAAVADTIARDLDDAGFPIKTDTEVRGLRDRGDEVLVVTDVETMHARLVVNCAGLHADNVARLAGLRPSVRIVPFRGEYYALSPAAAPLVKSMIYPVPDPRFPFLGVHFTRRIDGTVEAGPNAVLALGREHYTGTRADLGELRKILAFRGFRTLARRYWRPGLSEVVGSLSRHAYARRARRLVPALAARDLQRAGSGIRAQAVTTGGTLIDDFVIESTDRVINVLNAPSPAATASLAIGDHLAAIAEEELRGGH